jgi:hypothetical protein
MMSHDLSARPPRAPAWLVELFASPQEADGILGDLAEEFSASIERNGEHVARRWYWRQAVRTIGALAVSQWHSRPRATLALAVSGLLLTTGIWPAGLILTVPTGLAASALVTHYPVYHYIPASMFWQIVFLLPSLLAGIVIAIVPRAIRIRPMSAALALFAAMGVLNAVDLPIMVLFYGPPLSEPATLAHHLVRWVTGMSTFGVAVLVGGVIGRFALPRTRKRPALANG